MKKLILLFLLTLLVSSPTLAGNIEKINYIELDINGKKYEVPDANIEYRQKIYFLKKALKGDKDALDVLRGTDEFAWVFIGDSEPLWVRIDKRGRAEVIKP